MKNRVHRFFIAILFVLSFSGANAQSNVETAKNEYYLVFAARSPHLLPFSIGGHAFVTWGIRTTGDSIRAVQTFGFFPGEGSNLIDAISKTRPGRIRHGFFKNSNRQLIRQMVVQLDFETWKVSLDSALCWDGHDYNLFRANCLTFMDSIADGVNLETPAVRYATGYPKTPYKYIRQLRKRNKSRTVSNLKVFDRGDGICTEDFVFN